MSDIRPTDIGKTGQKFGADEETQFQSIFLWENET